MFFDPMYFVFVLPALFFAMWAQWRVQSTFGKYAQVANSTGLTGADVARRLLDAAGLHNIQVERMPGDLTDHYDPRAKVVRLSDSVYATPSVAAIGVTAHEVGHAIQDATAYAPMRLRQGLVPVAGIGSNLGYILFFIGVFIAPSSWPPWASSCQRGRHLRRRDPAGGVQRLQPGHGPPGRQRAGDAPGRRAWRSKVLDAAALTYVAGLAQAISQLLYYFFILTGMRRDE